MNTTFNNAAATATVIPFNPLWANATGYYDFAVKGTNAPILAAGEVVQSESMNNRKIVLVGTKHGNAVFFQRYSNCAPDGVIVTNMPMSLKAELFEHHDIDINGRVTEEVMAKFFAIKNQL